MPLKYARLQALAPQSEIVLITIRAQVFHPDLFIPWSALQVRETRWLLFPRAARLTLPSLPGVTVTVLLGEELLAAAPASSLLPSSA